MFSFAPEPIKMYVVLYVATKILRHQTLSKLHGFYYSNDCNTPNLNGHHKSHLISKFGEILGFEQKHGRGWQSAAKTKAGSRSEEDGIH